MLPAVALAVGATPSAYAADGWLEGVRVSALYVSPTPSFRLATNPSATSRGHRCDGFIRLQWDSANTRDDIPGRVAMYDTLLTALETGARIDVYINEVSGSSSVTCYGERLQIHAPSTNNPPPNNPPPNNPPPNNPPPNNPPPSNPNYYGAFAYGNGYDGWAWSAVSNHSSQISADLRAVEGCESKRGGKGNPCLVARRFGNGMCVAIYHGHHSDGNVTLAHQVGPRATIGTWRQELRNSCLRVSGVESCDYQGSRCNGGTASAPAMTTAPSTTAPSTTAPSTP